MDWVVDKERQFSLKLLQMALSPAGLVTIKYVPRGFRTSKILEVFVYLRILVYIPATIFNISNRLHTDEKSILIKITDSIQLIVGSLYTLTLWIYAIKEAKSHIELLSKIKYFDRKMAELGKILNYRKYARIAVLIFFVRILVCVFSIMGQIFTYTYATDIKGLAFYFCFYCTFLIGTLFCHMIIIYMSMIRRRFSVVNELLNELLVIPSIHIVGNQRKARALINKKHTNSLVLLSSICHLHHVVTKIVKFFNNLFGFCLLNMFIVVFVNLVVGLFYCSAAFESTDINWNIVINNMLLSICSAVDMVIICHLGHYGIEEAKKSGVLIHKIETNDYDMKDQIEMFSLQIANERVEFNAGGFFPINYTLVFSIIGGVTTYIIILIQLAANKTINP